MNDAVAPGRDGQRLSPPSVDPRHVATLNAFHRRRRPLIVRFAGLDASVSAEAGPMRRGTDEIAISFAVDSRPGELIVPGSLVSALLQRVDPSLDRQALAPEHTALLLELAIADAVDALEGVLGSRIEFESAVRLRPEPIDQASLPFAVRTEELGEQVVVLRGAPADTATLIGAMDRALGLPGSGQAIGFPVCLRIGAATVSRSELATLARGDVILADESLSTGGRVAAVVAEHLAAEVEMVATGVKVASRPARIAGSHWEWCREMPDQPSSPEPDDAADLGALPVRVVFELGRLELSFSEIQDLAPGKLLPLARPMEETLDIVANGRRIGRGALVRIGDSVGVRVTRLFADG